MDNTERDYYIDYGNAEGNEMFLGDLQGAKDWACNRAKILSINRFGLFKADCIKIYTLSPQTLVSELRCVWKDFNISIDN